MALQKQVLNINFAKGLDKKTDPKQVAPGSFSALNNSVFDVLGLLKKRNGFGSLTALPSGVTASQITTFNDNLTVLGNTVSAYSAASSTWATKGTFYPIAISTLSLIRSNTNQTYVDSAISASGLICTVYADSNGITTSYKYAIADATTGQNIVSPTLIPSSGTVTFTPKVFLLGQYFVIVYNSVISATNHLQYIAISINNPATVTAPSDLSAQYSAASTGTFDGVVVNSNLYVAWNGSDGGGAIRITYLSSTLGQANTVAFTGHAATHVSLCADTSNSTAIIWISFYSSSTTNGYAIAVNQALSTVLSPVQIITTETATNLTAVANAGTLQFFYEISNDYAFSSSINGDSSNATHYIKKNTLTQAGTLGSASVMVRSLGLASKAFIHNDTTYVLGVYSSLFQPTYFLVDNNGNVVAKLAYSNAGGYLVTGLPSVTLSGTTAKIPYQIKDLVEAANKTQGVASPAGVYAQLGLNIATFDFTPSRFNTVEIANNLHITGGFPWMYDGYLPVEHGFHLWPDHIGVTTSSSGGNIAADTYFYQVAYEWADNQGNIYRSAPSIPVTITTTGATSTNTIKVPTLRLTYKTANPVKIVVYRWATAGPQTYFQVTSIAQPSLNDTTTDSITITDTLTNSSIIGNNILYTTGGVVENIAAPATNVLSLFQARVFAVDAEDPNLLWYSKQVIENTPVEFSDLFTLYIAPSLGAQGPTGPTKALAALDDKLIIFKRDAIYYINGTGPDNTGANNNFSEPLFITSTVGSSNPNSIVFMPQGLMFESDKGIWLLGRDLSTQYIGAAVESYTQAGSVLSAVNIPGTNQVRFTLDSGITLMYDYYVGQWATFTNIPALSSTIYQELHTYLDSTGKVFQETPNTYLDGGNPVLLSFTTGWLNLAGLQGYERAYFFYLLAQYASPHKLTCQIAYDYNSSPTQTSVITPDNSTPNWGGLPLWGSGSAWGGSGNVEQWRVFLQQQKCEAFQITVRESYDPSLGFSAGAGFMLSGLDIVYGMKSGYARLKPSRSVG